MEKVTAVPAAPFTARFSMQVIVIGTITGIKSVAAVSKVKVRIVLAPVTTDHKVGCVVVPVTDAMHEVAPSAMKIAEEAVRVIVIPEARALPGVKTTTSAPPAWPARMFVLEAEPQMTELAPFQSAPLLPSGQKVPAYGIAALAGFCIV